MTKSGIETVTFWLVVRCLNLMCHHLPPLKYSYIYYWHEDFHIAFIIFILCMSRDNIVGILTCHRLDGSRVDSQWEHDFLHPSRPALSYPAS